MTADRYPERDGAKRMTSLPPPGAGPDPSGLTPLSRRLLRVAAALSALLIAVVVYAWRAGDEDANPLSPVFNPIAEAATRAERAPGMRVWMRGSVNSPSGILGHTTTIGETVYNGRTGRARGRITVTALGQTEQMQLISDGRTVWARSAGIAAKLPQGTEWLGVELEAPSEGQGSSEAAFGSSSDPRQQLQVLRSVAGEVVNLGAAKVGGVTTTAYRGDIDLGDLAATLRGEGQGALANSYEEMADDVPRMDVTVWIDQRGFLRQSETLMPIPATDDHPSAFLQVTATYSDFGIRPRISLPDSSRVYRAPPLPPSGTTS